MNLERCAKCGNPVEHDERAWFEIVGWEEPRKQGGTNAVSLRKRTGSVMHDGCMRQQKLGLPERTLFDE